MTKPLCESSQPTLTGDPILKLAQEIVSQRSSPFYPIKRRIAYVVSHGASYASNGYAVRTQGISQALNDHGFEILCFVRPGRPWDLDVKAGKIDIEKTVNGVRYIHSPWTNGKRPNSESERMIAMAKAFAKLFGVFRPQVVLAASNYEIALPALLAARQLNLPFHYEVRGFWEMSRISRDPAWHNTTDFLRYQDRENWVCNQAARLYTLNRFMRKELVKRGAAEQKIALVPNSVVEIKETWPSTGKELKASLGISKDAFLVGYIGALTEYEGLDLILEALASPKCSSVHALIVGGYSSINKPMAGHSEPIIENLTLYATQLGVSSRICFTGRVPHEELRGFYDIIDVMIIPRKPFPVCELVSAIKPLEYLAWGKPVIASDVAPQAELLEFGKLGWLFKKGSSEALADTIQIFRNATLEAREIKVNKARSVINSRYLWRDAVQPMVQGLSVKGQ